MKPEALLVLLIVPFAILATVLGWLAVGQIRRSGGKRCGLWLAVADGLLFPLLGLFPFIAWITRQFSILVLGWPLDDPVKNALGIFSTLTIFGASAALIVWLVWRAVKRPLAPAAPLTTRRVALGCGVALLIVVLTHVALVALVFSLNNARQAHVEQAVAEQVRARDQEMARAKAEVEAARAKAMAATARFGPLQEGLADRSGRGGFDLDTGRFIPFEPQAVGTDYDAGAMGRAHRWMQAHGVDFFGDPDSARPGLLITAVDRAVLEVDASLWDADPKDLITMLPPPPPAGVYTDHQTFIDAPQGTGHPKTRLIRTQQGGAAILQILEATDRREVKFRYKPILTGPDQ